MMGSGTISGPTEDSFGSMLLLGGGKPIKMADNTERKFINDNDTVIMKGFANGHVRIGFENFKQYYLLCTKKIKLYKIP
jgi:fumarylacetoacetase